MHESKKANLLSMSGDERFAYFIRKVADFEEAWGLYEDGWAMAADESGRRVMALWPEKELAEVCAQGVWSSYSAKNIPLEALLERWIPGMSDDDVGVGIFPTPLDKGVVVDPQKLSDALNEELEELN